MVVGRDEHKNTVPSIAGTTTARRDEHRLSHHSDQVATSRRAFLYILLHDGGGYTGTAIGIRHDYLAMQSKRFQRKVEDFVCEHCGAKVQGSGYTNHCPKCLWSKHVDVNPGDRAAQCGGMMEPVALEGSSPNYRIVHRCTLCSSERRVGVETGDDIQAVVDLAGRR